MSDEYEDYDEEEDGAIALDDDLFRRGRRSEPPRLRVAGEGSLRQLPSGRPAAAATGKGWLSTPVSHERTG